MASVGRLVEIIDTTLNLRGSALYQRKRLVEAGVIQGKQGPGGDAPLADVAMVLTSVMIGTTATTRPDTVRAYMALQAPDRSTFGDALTGYLADPHDLLELAIDAVAPAAAIRHRDGTGNVISTLFLSEEDDPRPGFTRMAVLTANTFTQLAEAIRQAPPATKRRRRRRRSV
ncbi:hypothetical protein C5L14_16695 [Labrys okinawensis]|uniref:Uncharacterized protein n=1 Tax=Labrys okinawensis TaxID=346911 RepID=A0A2S9QC53_9HYPH|nr:hypothetical protein [Labrys okinawensis]PRH86924.1 hypothetical protein C5L14_16695 [Labrys okinawensis]